MTCSVDGIVFGVESKKAIKEIRDMTKGANWLSSVLALSALGDIFVKNGPISASYKIYTTDFELLGQAMSSSTPILRRKVSDLAGSMVILKASSLTASEKKFWRCVYNEVR
ncbi:MULTISPECIES: hypothetical protein [Vibrio]|jgi:hypothetical protein|uniref:hypothetical protein n=1 Tax=Vibrio TaxID=662 RepID=UPI0013021A58|nr:MULTISPECIES: hypothetical protein [Vibrio]MBE4609706.1 hypothetical protein [Vibrio navarrensis]MBE4613389.1 hypothetical protein [Vibrio navarrensis]MCG3734699.1 hypothetical protein [Vibrio cincinnatiensis]MCG3737876.1 hypothetical protein [Vibrio cincinnatiensis]MCG3741787.1 hypothetical protein [Vibrio cincinnatiensis]